MMPSHASFSLFKVAQRAPQTDTRTGSPNKSGGILKFRKKTFLSTQHPENRGMTGAARADGGRGVYSSFVSRGLAALISKEAGAAAPEGPTTRNTSSTYLNLKLEPILTHVTQIQVLRIGLYAQAQRASRNTKELEKELPERAHRTTSKLLKGHSL